MRTKFAFLCATLCLLANASQCRAITCGLVANCGFETGTFSGWTLSGNDVPGQLDDLYGVEGVDPIDSIGPHSGTSQAFFADLASNATTIQQTIATIIGATYKVSWYMAQDTLATAQYGNEVIASFAGTPLASLSAIPVEGYTLYTYSGYATSTSSVLSFTIGDGLGEVLLDDVSVVATPEPPEWILLLTAMIATSIFFRRQKHLRQAAR